MGELIPNRGNYKNLICYKKTDIIFQITFYFAHKYLKSSDRTIDQMIQAARSGKQNIIEGSAASATSTKTEIRLINVAKSSLRELLEDYEDFLKTRNLRIWEKGSLEYETMRKLGREHDEPDFFMKIIETRPPETIANMAVILLNQADFLLYKLLEKLEDQFINNGGFSERMYKLRKDNRDKRIQ